MICKSHRMIFHLQQNLQHISVVESETFYPSLIHLKPDGSNTSKKKKVGTGACVPLCSIPSFLNVQVRRPIAGGLREECWPIVA